MNTTVHTSEARTAIDRAGSGLWAFPGADGLPEVAFLGRSNVGKSSLLNVLAGTKGLARVSQHPGRTQLVNFFRMGDEAFHTYSAYARGVESVTDAYSLLDRTPYGRQEDFEDSPEGWPQRPTYG